MVLGTPAPTSQSGSLRRFERSRLTRIERHVWSGSNPKIEVSFEP